MTLKKIMFGLFALTLVASSSYVYAEAEEDVAAAVVAEGDVESEEEAVAAAEEAAAEAEEAVADAEEAAS